MSEQLGHNEALPPGPAEQELLVLIKKMQQQLLFLEKKIDILINNQSQARPTGERQFSKPYRSFERPYRPYDRAYGSPSGEKSFDRGRHFEKRHSEEGRGREGDFSPKRHFEKRHEGVKKGFDPKKKPFTFRKKERR
jgi:hypothetical protein